MSELQAQALRASAMIDPAELHGMVCGMAASRPAQFSLPELVDLAGEDALTDEVAVREFVTSTLDQMHAQDMEFYLLIPDDDNLISARLEGLASWTAAFLTGFGAGVAALDQHIAELPMDVQEILRDFASISALDTDSAEADDGSNEDEASFVELYEYVRVAAVLTLAMMDPDAGAPDDAEPVH